MNSKQLQLRPIMNKRKFTIFFCISVIQIFNTSNAQFWNEKSIKMEAISGHIIPFDKVKQLLQNPVSGCEISIESQTMGDKQWHQYHNFPVVGLGAVWLNLGNPDKLGNAFALYPYINTALLRNNYFNLYLKTGAGVSYLTKTYYNTNKDALGNLLPSLSGTNAAIGSALNVYFSGGASLDIPITNGFSATADYTWNHMSNGSTVAPNAGLNLMNGFVGFKYMPNYKNYTFPTKQSILDLPRKYTFEIIASSGFRQLYYLDNKTFPIASFSLSVLRPITNYYRMGLGLDGFYDGAYDGNTKFKRTHIQSDELKNKLRGGISWQHELVFGRLTAGLHLGVYLYDPLKNLGPCDTNGNLINPTLRKPIFYTYDIELEDGWLYTRAALKYSFTEHLFFSLGLKTHLQKAEFIEWGVGCRL